MSQGEEGGPEQIGQDEELDSAMGEIHAAERARKLRTVIVGAVVLMLVGGLFYVIAQYSEDFFRPNIDVDEGEMELLEDTGDPVCRGMIAEVYEVAEDFGQRELEFEDEIWGDDEEALDQLGETATAFRSRLERLSHDIDDAVFREEGIAGHPPVPDQVREWFENMDNEFRILEEMAERRLKKVRDEEVAERGGLWEEPEELRDTVLMTIDENFEEFRVWVARGGHPCGAPPEGVEPWQE